MFANMLEKKKEKRYFARLCFIVALADSNGEKGNVAKYFLEKVLKEPPNYENALGATIGILSAVISSTMANEPDNYEEIEKLPFLEHYFINDQEAELLEQISVTLKLDLEEFRSILLKANEIYKGAKDDYEKLFSILIPQILEEDISFRSKKILLFEMCNMAFKDGECSEIEKTVIRIAGKEFKIDTDTIEEIITESGKLNKSYNACYEIITE